jgi:putative nucleotidyltransferase with HDIG domain
MLNHVDQFRNNQRKLTLSVIAWVILFTAIGLGILNLQYKTWTSVLALFSLALLCIPILILNSYDYYTSSGILLSFVILIVIGLNLYDGDGILDPAGILAYPICIICGSLLLGKRFVPFFLFGSIASLFTLVYLERAGYIHPTIHEARFSDLTPIIIILLVTSLIVWFIINNVEKNLERVKITNAELYKNYNLTLEAWAKVLEYRDRETAGHSARVTELSTRLAYAIGCTEAEIEQLRSGAILHDIGKLAVPDNILLKPAKLDEAEMEIMQKHPLYGKQMLSGVSFLESAIPIVYCHHERWDGQGYPQGLKGEQIPLLARMFSIVDCWDALNSDRPYRQAWPQEKTVNYLKENAGSSFDPHIVEKFLQIV